MKMSIALILVGCTILVFAGCKKQPATARNENDRPTFEQIQAEGMNAKAWERASMVPGQGEGENEINTLKNRLLMLEIEQRGDEKKIKDLEARLALLEIKMFHWEDEQRLRERKAEMEKLLR